MKRKVGNRLAPSQGIENSLYNAIRPLVSAMCERVDSAIRRERLYEVRQPICNTFKHEARAIVCDFLNRVIQHTRVGFRSATKGFEAEVQDVLHERKSARRMEKRWRECEQLIADLPVKFFDKLDVAIRSYNSHELTAAGFDTRYEDLKRQVYVRARLIAHTQNCRATEDLLLSRCEESGVTRVRWCHSHLSAKPRDYHLRKWDGHSGKRNGKPNGLNGYEFDISKPPVIDLKTGERGFPAQLINCKCYLVPLEDM